MHIGRSPRPDSRARDHETRHLRRSRAAKEAIAKATNLDRPSPEAIARFHHHYAYWQEKWGWDLLNPDMDHVLATYGGTEVCWRYDDAMRAAGELIAAAWLE